MTALTTTNENHPLWISATEDYSTAYILGTETGTKVTVLAEGAKGIGRQIKVEIDLNEPATDLWYVCQNHAGMGNESDIVTAAGSSDYGKVTVSGY